MNKRIASILCLFLVALLVSGCIPKPNTPENLPLSEIAEISFHVQQDVTLPPFAEVLAPEQYQSFLTDFTALTYHTYWNDPVNEVGTAFIRISFQDDTWYDLNHYCTVYYDGSSSNDLRVYYGIEEFALFWETYCSVPYSLK